MVGPIVFEMVRNYTYLMFLVTKYGSDGFHAVFAVFNNLILPVFVFCVIVRRTLDKGRNQLEI